MKSLFCALSVLLLIGGCTSTEALGDRAVEYNVELEESTNATMLMNVVRASKRVPMTFSRLGSMAYTGSLGIKPSATFAVGANSEAANDVLGFSLESNDSGVTQLQALTGQTYHRAINQSIKPERVSFYRDRGWSDVLLFSVFIEKIEMELGFLSSTITAQKCANYTTPSGRKRCGEQKALLTDFVKNETARTNTHFLSSFINDPNFPKVHSTNTITLSNCASRKDQALSMCRDRNELIKAFVSETPLSLLLEDSLTRQAFTEVFLDETECAAYSQDELAQSCTALQALFNSFLSANKDTDTNKFEEFFEFRNDPDSLNAYVAYRAIAATVINNYEVNLEDQAIDPDTAYYPEPYCKRNVSEDKAKAFGDLRVRDALGDTEPTGEGDAKDFTTQDEFTQKDCEALQGYEPMAEIEGYETFDFSALPKDMKILRGVVFKKQKTDQILKFKARNAVSGGNENFGCTLAAGDRGSPSNTTCSVRIVLRSPKDMLYYLGELHRAQVNEKAAYLEFCGKKPGEEFRIGIENLCAEDNEDSLFFLETSGNVLTVRRAGIANNKLFPFEYAGSLYWVSDNDVRRGRTMQFIALLNEIFYLNQEASDAPVVSVIQGATIQ